MWKTFEAHGFVLFTRPARTMTRLAPLAPYTEVDGVGYQWQGPDGSWVEPREGYSTPFDDFEGRFPNTERPEALRQAQEAAIAQQVAELKQQLHRTEHEEMEALRKQRNTLSHDEWDKRWEGVCKRAADIRRVLFDLTGDCYGEPEKKKQKKPDDALLLADYPTPDDVPVEVMQWVRKHCSLLTSDATDAVRWSRIVDTLDDERYPEGDMAVFRAVDSGCDEIRPGDWVTTDREYAEMHLRRYLDGNGNILEAIVDGSDVLISPTGDAEEAIYAPREFSGPIQERSDSPSP